MRLDVCPLAQLPPGSARTASSSDLEVAVFNVDGELYALDNACAHAGGPLAEGWVRDGTVTCPLHWWRYDLASGRRCGADRIAQATFPVEVVDGSVVVIVPEPQPATGIRQALLRHAAEWDAQHRDTAEPEARP